jgi:hypothetical protein
VQVDWFGWGDLIGNIERIYGRNGSHCHATLQERGAGRSGAVLRVERGDVRLGGCSELAGCCTVLADTQVFPNQKHNEIENIRARATWLRLMELEHDRSCPPNYK